MDQSNQLPISSSNVSCCNQSAKENLVDLLGANQYYELLDGIVEKLESKDSRPTSCSTPDMTRKVTTPTPKTNQYYELLDDIVEKLESKDSRPTSCSTPDMTRKVITPTPTTTPIRKISQSNTQHVSESTSRNETSNQRSGDVIQNTNEEIAECINFLCVLIFGIMGFGVFIMLLEFVPKSNVTAAVSVVGACLLLVLMFSFMSTLARKRTPLNRR